MFHRKCCCRDRQCKYEAIPSRTSRPCEDVLAELGLQPLDLGEAEDRDLHLPHAHPGILLEVVLDALEREAVREINLAAKELAAKFGPIDEAGDSGDLAGTQTVYEEMVALFETLEKYAQDHEDEGP